MRMNKGRVLGLTASAVGVAAFSLTFTGTAFADGLGDIGKDLGLKDKDHDGYYNRYSDDDGYGDGYSDYDGNDNHGIGGFDTSDIDGGKVLGDSFDPLSFSSSNPHLVPQGGKFRENGLLNVDPGDGLGGNFGEMSLPFVGKHNWSDEDQDDVKYNYYRDSLHAPSIRPGSIGARSYHPSVPASDAGIRTVSARNFRADLFDDHDFNPDFGDAFGKHWGDDFGNKLSHKLGGDDFDDDGDYDGDYGAKDYDDAGDFSFKDKKNVLSHQNFTIGGSGEKNMNGGG